MLFEDISVLDEHFQKLDHQFVGIKDSYIDFIGDARPFEDYGEVVNGRGKLLMSGLYNLHTHLPMTLLRGYGENLPLQRWLEERIFPFEDHLDGESVYHATVLGLAEMMKYGVVACSDMYFFCDSVAQAFADTGMKAAISRSLVSFDDTDLKDLDRFSECKELFQKWSGACDGRIRIDMSVHAEYTNTEKIVIQLAEYAKELGTGMHVHLSETLKEHEECKARRGGRTPAQFFEDCGVFDVPATAAHCVYAEENDLDIFVRHGVTVAHCPVSNLKLGSGVAPVARMLQKGVQVAVGTDGVASNNNGNLLEEIKLTPMLQKGIHRDPTLVTCTQVMQMATVNGASAQGRTDCGALKAGNRADLLMIDLNQPNLTPCHDFLHNLVYSMTESNILMTMADGKVLYQNGEYKTLDIEKALYHARRCTSQILKQL